MKLQLDATITLKKAIYAARQSDAAKREQAQMRNFLAKVTNDDFGEAIRQSKSHPMNMVVKPQSTKRKCNFCGRSPAHENTMCPVRQTTCFICRKVCHFGVVCRSTKSAEALSKNKTDPEVAFLGEVTKNDDPWTTTVAMKAIGTLSVRSLLQVGHWGRCDCNLST